MPKCFLGEPFKHDLFVSYSHGAFRGKHEPELKAWSQKFAEDLREEIALLDGFDEISVFLDESDRSDENVDRTEQLTGLLQGRVVGSALFTLLMTPKYLRSKWCRQEFDWWCKKHHPDMLGAGARLYVCRVLPSDEGNWPEPIKDVVGHFCYDRDKEPEMARPFTWRGASDDRYGDILTEIAGAMAQRLRAVRIALERRRESDQAAARLTADGGQVIYLHARETYAEAWERARDGLVDKKLVVLPGEPDPIAREPAAIREMRTAESRQ